MNNEKTIMLKRSMILAGIASDERLPRKALGYVALLQSSNIINSIELDCINQIRKYIKEFSL